MADDFSKTYEKLKRKFFRDSVRCIWGMVKSGWLDELSEQEYKLALIIIDHQEYCELFENTDILDGRIIPTHCTGRKAVMHIKEEMPDQFILKHVWNEADLFLIIKHSVILYCA